MKILNLSGKSDYRIIFLSLFALSALFGVLLENVLFRFSGMDSEEIISVLGTTFDADMISKSKLFWYLFRSEFKIYGVFLILSYTAIGMFSNTIICCCIIYRYIFLMAAIFRCNLGSRYILCIAAVLLCFVCCVPVLVYGLKTAVKSYQYCNSNGTKLYHCTKYQLQTDVKIGIIMVLYIMLGIAVKSTVCAGLFIRMFE